MNVFNIFFWEGRPWDAEPIVSLRGLRALLLFCTLSSVSLVAPATAFAQEVDVLGAARAAAASGRRNDALAMLAAHLADSPRDVDARLLYGLVLSWDGQYDEARRHLHLVLDQTPGYTDARVALMNVEWWSGRSQAARETADVILSREPGNEAARTLRDRLDAQARPWWAGVTYGNDTFSDGRSGWHEGSLSVTRLTSRGSVIARVNEARRFGLDDRLVEIEFYPRIRPGTYLFASAGAAPDATLYPSHRLAFDLYQAVGGGIEASFGMRRLAFNETTYIYVATVSKYLGNWLLTGRVFHVPGEGRLDSTSYHGGVRRYVRGDGASYVGLTYSHGFSREEIRNLADLTTLDADTLRAEINQQLSGRLRVFASGGTSRQERQNRSPLWQTSVSSGVMVLF